MYTCNLSHIIGFKSNIWYDAIHICRLHGTNNIVNVLNTECWICAISGNFCFALFCFYRFNRKNMYVHTFQFNCSIPSFSRSTDDCVNCEKYNSNDECLVQKKIKKRIKNVTLINLSWAFFVLPKKKVHSNFESFSDFVTLRKVLKNSNLFETISFSLFHMNDAR